MKIYIVDMGYINRTRSDDVEVGIGPMIISGILKDNGHKIIYCDKLIRHLDDMDKIVNNVKAVRPHVLIFSTRSDNYILSIIISQKIKNADKKIINIFAGPQATHTARETLEAFEFVDYIIRNEGEETTKELLDVIQKKGDLSTVEGISYRRNEHVLSNEDREMIKELKYLPDYSVIPKEHVDIMLNRMVAIRIEAGRGCPYNCTFCSTNRMWHRKYRLKSAETIYAEMKQVYEKFGMTKFVLEHDSLAANPMAFREFLVKMKELNKEGFLWKCSSRIDTLRIEDITLMHDAGCSDVYFGIESGSEKLQSIYKKNLRFDNVQRLFAELGKNNIFFIGSFICGHPEESKEDLEKTLRLMVFCKMFFNCEDVQLHRLSPENGSELYDLNKEKLILDVERVSDQATDIRDDFEANIVRDYPEIFASYYSLKLPTQMVAEYDNVFSNGIEIIKKYPITLNFLLHKGNISVLDMIRWKKPEIEEHMHLVGKQCSSEVYEKIISVFSFEQRQVDIEHFVENNEYISIDFNKLTGQNIIQSKYVTIDEKGNVSTYLNLIADIMYKMNGRLK